MALFQVEKGGEKYLDWAKRKLRWLSARRIDLGVPVMSQHFKIGASDIWIKASEFGDMLRITGGVPVGFDARGWSTSLPLGDWGVGLFDTYTGVDSPTTGLGMRFARYNMVGKACFSRDYDTLVGTDPVSGLVRIRRVGKHPADGTQDTIVPGSVSAGTSWWNMYAPDVASMSADGNRVLVKTDTFPYLALYAWNGSSFADVTPTVPAEVQAWFDGGSLTYPGTLVPFGNQSVDMHASWGGTATVVLSPITDEAYLLLQYSDMVTTPHLEAATAQLYAWFYRLETYFKIYKLDGATGGWTLWRDLSSGDQLEGVMGKVNTFPNGTIDAVYGDVVYERAKVVFDGDGAARLLTIKDRGLIQPIVYTCASGVGIYTRIADGYKELSYCTSPPADPEFWTLTYSSNLPWTSFGADDFASEVELQLDGVPWISDIANDQTQLDWPAVDFIGQADRGQVRSTWTGDDGPSTGRKGQVWRHGTYGVETVFASTVDTKAGRSGLWVKRGTDLYYGAEGPFAIPPTRSTVGYVSWHDDDRMVVLDTTDPFNNTIFSIMQMRRPLLPDGTIDPTGDYDLRVPVEETEPGSGVYQEIPLGQRQAVGIGYHPNRKFLLAILNGVTYDKFVPDGFIYGTPLSVRPTPSVPAATTPTLGDVYVGRVLYPYPTYGSTVTFPPDYNPAWEKSHGGVVADASGAWYCSGTELRWYDRDTLWMIYRSSNLVVDGPQVQPVSCAFTP